MQVLPPQDAPKLDPAGIEAAFANPIGGVYPYGAVGFGGGSKTL